MQQNLRDFLFWYEGFAENVAEQPTPTQWSRIKDRLGRLKEEVLAAPIMAPSASAAPAPVVQTSTEHTAWSWKRDVKAALEEHGYDPESADEVLVTITVDLSQSPQLVADRVIVGGP